MGLYEFIHSPEGAHVSQLLISAGLGAVIGLERELSGKDPSLRTFALICMGSCLFTLMSLDAAATRGTADPGRIAAQILPGIGFLGAGAIFRSSRGVSGLTTAALMWVTAAIGMAVGFGHNMIAVAATTIGLTVIILLRIVHMGLNAYFPEHDEEKRRLQTLE